MRIARILCPIVTLGPGKRLVIWTRGCSRHCPGCISPELAAAEGAADYDVGEMFDIIKNIYDTEGFDGVTISGGDPFEQLEELLNLTERLQTITDDILVYTGYVWEQLKDTLDEKTEARIKSSISVLIDGPYLQEKNTPDLALRGSDNQRIIFFDPEKERVYAEYLKRGRQVQNIYYDNKLLSVGLWTE